ncbi:MAG: sucrose synthase [Hydrococcus sp. C42_A2020_068]|uniref:sucrose synthase n=1 Tax=Pleurocapsa sp. PCC 7327 TaxID=118163 RepID=UPI00029FFF6F|nr:sucrose synthase [Pleurocapsa sp. PCC 7327]AFY77339.1 sucrose synthase [Pleurocapsa sp. PCC 7327]MBF2020635.1 sucrose synthase [Hydrococcus sp. C42_A2020_068]
MYELIQVVLNSDEKKTLRQLLAELRTSGKQFFVRNEIQRAFEESCRQLDKPAYFYHSSSIAQLIHHTHEILLDGESFWFLLRPRIGSQQVFRLAADLSCVEPMTAQALLDLRDRLVDRYAPQILEIDFSPFYRGAPIVDDPRNIGQGLEFLHRYLFGKISANPQHWLEGLFNILHEHQHDGISLFINDRIGSATELIDRVKEAIEFVNQLPPNMPYETFRLQFQQLGFEPGWGNTASRIRETLELLERSISNPQHAVVEALIARLPITRRVVLISVHGWVGQENVLGRAETVGQVVYVLDQARSLEHQLREEMHQAGLDVVGIEPQVIILTRLIPNCEGTSCNLRLEKVYGTENAWILRVPFQDFNPKVTQNWISKFEIWPYLETFALDAERELIAQLKGKPDLIIGNYSDGNLVAFLLARRFQATQCNIAHALEKPRYLFSDLYWQDLEERYHFSAQFTADLIAMNAADFIIASSYQEIVGNPDNMGQYESYKCFTMPQLYHAIDGIELFSPKFNVVPPGVNENIFFPYTQTEDRIESDRKRIYNLLFTDEDPRILGYLDNPNKRPIFAVGPINAIKNFTGLVECFGRSQALQERCNLIMSLGNLHAEEATNPEERKEIESLHALIEQYHLQGQIRWLGMRLTSADLGEAYRVIADFRGIFVHFARFEAFGITILEAMISGLPTFATQFGGALEILREGISGFHINPTDLEGTAQKIVDFIDKCEVYPQYWHEISQGAIEQVRDRYNWQDHTRKLVSLSKISNFWNHISQENREALYRYLEALFHLIYKPRAEKILEKHLQQ